MLISNVLVFIVSGVIQGLSYPGNGSRHHDIIMQYDCKRICTLYVVCEAFAMEWLNSTKEKGYCVLTSHKVQPEDVVVNSSSSLFGEYVY